jgi:thiamine-monophosphate kinase
MPGEFDFIDWVRRLQPRSALVPVPAGDDLAVLDWPAGDLLLVGVDQVLDGVHFDAAVHAPRLIGRKAMNRNLSDCAAMACLPAAAVVTLALPRGAGGDYARELYLGAKEAGDAVGCAIVGGRHRVVARPAGRHRHGPRPAGRRPPVTRGGARPGDRLYVSGPLGGSILGRHLSFAPRVEQARRLAEGGAVTAMLDLSDGLSRDVAHLCRESGVGAVIDAAGVPVHDDARALSARDGRPPLDHALHDGEDYELLRPCRRRRRHTRWRRRWGSCRSADGCRTGRVDRPRRRPPRAARPAGVGAPLDVGSIAEIGRGPDELGALA